MKKRTFFNLNIQRFAGNNITKIEDLIDPEVMAPMISAKLENEF